MRKPSIKTLRAAFGENAPEARRIFEMSRAELERTETGAEIARGFHHGYCESLAFFRLLCLNACGGFHGVEAVRTSADEYAEFLNAGDTYALTVIRWRGNYRVQTLGDFIETMERRGVRFV